MRRKRGRRLEAQVEERLRGADLDDAVVALTWMHRLSFRSASLWQVCADSVELSLRNPRFVRDRLPEAIDALAALSGGAEAEQEATLVASLLCAPEVIGAAEVQGALTRYPAHFALRLLRAAVVAASTPGSSEARVVKALAPLSTQVSRLGQQLTLWERRSARQAAELLDDISGRHSLGIELQVESLRSLSSAPLPPLIGEHEAAEADFETVEVGPELLLRRAEEGEAPRAVRFLGPSDVFAAPRGEAVRPTPACRTAVRVAELQGWEVELCP